MVQVEGDHAVEDLARLGVVARHEGREHHAVAVRLGDGEQVVRAADQHDAPPVAAGRDHVGLLPGVPEVAHVAVERRLAHVVRADRPRRIGHRVRTEGMRRRGERRRRSGEEQQRDEHDPRVSERSWRERSATRWEETSKGETVELQHAPHLAGIGSDAPADSYCGLPYLAPRRRRRRPGRLDLGAAGEAVRGDHSLRVRSGSAPPSSSRSPRATGCGRRPPALPPTRRWRG